MEGALDSPGLYHLANKLVFEIGYTTHLHLLKDRHHEDIEICIFPSNDDTLIFASWDIRRPKDPK